MQLTLTTMTIILIVMALVSIVQGAEWEPVTGEENLRNFMSGIKAERTLPNG